MGCWNQTCGLTQIHILAGEKVMVFPLVKSEADSLCYSTPFWTPFPVPFSSEYDDYGAGENSTGLGLDMVIEFLRGKLVELEVGKNKFHDIAVKRDCFDEQLFWNAIHEQRLAINTYNGDKEVRMVMIKQSIIDYLIEHNEFSLYEGYDANGSKYTKYKFADIVASLDGLLDELFVKETNLPDGISEELRAKFERLMSYKMLEQAAEAAVNKDEHNWAGRWLQFSGSHLSYGSFSSHLIESRLTELVEANDREGARELLIQHLVMRFVDSFIMSVRKFWSPQAGAGSQNASQDGYRLLAKAMTHVLDEEKARWDAEDE